MYAVIESGGKQYKVTEGLVIKLEKLPFEVEQTIDFDKVLLINKGDNTQLGTPYTGTKVSATVVAQGRHKKIKVLKFRRRKHHMKQMGHRQYYTQVKITSIQ